MKFNLIADLMFQIHFKKLAEMGFIERVESNYSPDWISVTSVKVKSDHSTGPPTPILFH